MNDIKLSPNTLSLILGGILLFLLTNNKGCDLTPPAPSAARITPSPTTLAACAPIKTAAAVADASKRSRLAAAFDDLALALSTAGDNVKTTGSLSDVIQSFGDIVAAAEPDLRAAVPINTALTQARDTTFAALPGTGADKPISKAQAADFVAAVAASLR